MKRLAIVFLMVAFVVTAGTAFAATINVPADYATVQAAIDAAVDGDTVMVAAGDYVENISINKSVSVIGAGADSTFIGTDQAWPTDAVKITASGLTLSGFHIRGGVLCHGASPVIEHNVIRNKYHYYGIYAAYDWQGHKSSPTIQNNVIYGSQDGIEVFYSNAIIRNNFIMLNDGWGIDLAYFSRPTIVNNTIVNNTLGAVGTWYYDRPVVMNNIMAGNGEFGLANGYRSYVIYNSYNLYHNNMVDNYGTYWYNYSPKPTPDPTEIYADPEFANAPLWTSAADVNTYNPSKVSLPAGVSGEAHTIPGYKQGTFVQLGFDSMPRNIARINEVRNALQLDVRPSPEHVPLDEPGVRFINVLGHNRDLDWDWSLTDGSPAIDAGNPDPAYNDTDGTRNDLGATGGPHSEW